MPEGSTKVNRFPVLWIRMVEDVFQMERKECEEQEKLKR